MSPFDFFRNFFLGKSSAESPKYSTDDDYQYQDNFRNPIWQTEDDDDDVNDYRRRSNPGNTFHFQIFSDPFQITQYFESQMDNMLKNFFNGFDGFESTRAIFPFENHEFTNALPSPQERPKENLRDEFLKPGYEYRNHGEPKVDSDLDGKIGSSDLSKIWADPSTSGSVDLYRPQTSIQSFGKSVSTKIVRRPDGSVEEKQTIRDSAGNEEIKVTRKIGDKVHTIITKRDKDGSETKTENLINIDESELNKFNDKWTWSAPQPSLPGPSNGNGDLNYFPWEKFFGPNPKL